MAQNNAKTSPRDDDSIDRLPPQDLNAERAVLGSMLIEPEAVVKAIEILHAEDFYRDAHKDIFAAMASLFTDAEPVDALTVASRLSRENRLEAVGGNYYLTGLANSVASAANVEYHARIVLEKSLLRKLILTSTDIISRAYAGGDRATELIDQAQQSIFSLSERGLRRSFEHLHPILKKTFETIESFHNRKGTVTGVPSGFRQLDELTSGFQDSDLIIVAGRPSMGKTAFCLNVARNAAVDHGVGVGFFSLEMANYQLAMRMLCAEAKVDAHKVRTGSLEKDKWRRLSDAAGKLYNAPMYIDDTPGISILELRAKARRLLVEHNIGLLVVDYLQLIRGQRSESRQQEISMISQSLKALAKELNIPVIALSQLSRAVESRTDRRPMLSDLRESGALEQDADVVMFVYREDAYGPSENEGLAEIIIGKQRNGPTGTVQLGFLKKFVKFENLDSFHQDYNAQPDAPGF